MRNFGSGKVLSGFLLLGIVAYVVIAVGFAGYLLWQAYSHALTDFDKAAIGALIAIIGTGLTAAGALYTANRQAAAAHSVELLKLETGKDLAAFNSKLTSGLDTMKAQAAESLERLKVALDTGKVAHRELFGAATTYFYALRSAAQGDWDVEALKKAEALMIETARHVIYVSDKMRNDWFFLWQIAQEISLAARAEPDLAKRAELIGKKMLEKIPGPDLNLRELHHVLEETAKKAVASDRLQVS